MGDAYEPIGPTGDVPEAPDESVPLPPPPPDMPAPPAPAAEGGDSFMALPKQPPEDGSKVLLSGQSGAKDSDAATKDVEEGAETKKKEGKKTKKKGAAKKEKKTVNKMKWMIILIAGSTVATICFILLIVLIAHKLGANFIPAFSS